MKKIIRLTESDLKRIVNRVINEDMNHVINLYKSWAKNKSGNYDKAMSLMDDVLSNQKSLSKKDFASYGSVDELEDDLNKIKDKKQKSELSKDVDIIFEDDNLLVVKAKTYEASCKYGAGTKWCTAGKETDVHWDRHNRTGVEFIWINKNLPEKDDNHKLSLFFEYRGNIDWCNRINRCNRKAPYEVNGNLGVPNWMDAYKLCKEYFKVAYDEYMQSKGNISELLQKNYSEIQERIDNGTYYDLVLNNREVFEDYFDFVCYYFRIREKVFRKNEKILENNFREILEDNPELFNEVLNKLFEDSMSRFSRPSYQELLEDDNRYIVNLFDYLVRRCGPTIAEIFMEVFEPVLGFFHQYAERRDSNY